MFSTVSMTGVGAIVTLIEALLRVFGVEVAEGSVGAGVNGLVSFVGLVLMVWGQIRRKDLKFGLLRA